MTTYEWLVQQNTEDTLFLAKKIRMATDDMYACRDLSRKSGEDTSYWKAEQEKYSDRVTVYTVIGTQMMVNGDSLDASTAYARFLIDIIENTTGIRKTAHDVALHTIEHR
jgi:hypothetical protein